MKKYWWVAMQSSEVANWNEAWLHCAEAQPRAKANSLPHIGLVSRATIPQHRGIWNIRTNISDDMLHNQ